MVPGANDGTTVVVAYQSAVAAVKVYSSPSPEIQDFLAGGTITAGDWVKISLQAASAPTYPGWSVIVAPVAQINASVVGVALESVVAGQQVPVCIYGFCAGVAFAAAEGDLLTLSQATTAGRALVATVAAVGVTPAKVVGVAQVISAANVGSVFVTCK